MRNFARDIPPCPDHIRDEVLYANLLFGANRCSVSKLRFLSTFSYDEKFTGMRQLDERC